VHVVLKFRRARLAIKARSASAYVAPLDRSEEDLWDGDTMRSTTPAGSKVMGSPERTATPCKSTPAARREACTRTVRPPGQQLICGALDLCADNGEAEHGVTKWGHLGGARIGRASQPSL
jgi:hypothetical protein